MSGTVSKGDVRFLVEEALGADRALRAGDRDRYLIGLRHAYVACLCRILHIKPDDMNRYMEFVHEQVVRKEVDIKMVEEIHSWLRKNPA